MILVGENLNIMSKTLGPALRDRNAGPVKAMAEAEDSTDIDYLDLNIGPARKSGEEFMAWIVNTVQEVTSKPLSLDTTNPVAMEAGLKVCRGKALINSISLQSDRLESELPLVNKYNVDMIGLLWGVDGMPRDANERCLLAVDLVYKANEQGISNERIWLDPIVTPVSGEINQLKSTLEFMSMLPDIAPGCKSIVGLSNVSNGTPPHLRPYLNRTFLMILMKLGLHAAIIDAFDSELIELARGRRSNLTELVNKLINGGSVNPESLNQEELKYYKSYRVLNGETLYSHSWLEI
jgi:5-methyltetrahydrofolate corrinoid/iron sulfur protein methyltransferase